MNLITNPIVVAVVAFLAGFILASTRRTLSGDLLEAYQGELAERGKRLCAVSERLANRERYIKELERMVIEFAPNERLQRLMRNMVGAEAEVGCFSIFDPDKRRPS